MIARFIFLDKVMVQMQANLLFGRASPLFSIEIQMVAHDLPGKVFSLAIASVSRNSKERLC